MIVTIVAATLLGPPLVDRFADRLDRPEIRSLEPLSSDAVADTDIIEPLEPTAPGVSEDGNGDRQAPPSTTPSDGSPTTPATGDTSTTTPESADEVEPVRVIQLVPALRDVIVRIDGQDIASDDDGLVQVPMSSPGAAVEFIGLRAQPSLREVSFGSWSDGDMLAERSLADLRGPVVQMGLVVSNRVTVSTRESVPDGSEIRFESDAGTLTLTVGRTAWVPASRAVYSADGFEEQSLSYTSRSLVTPDTTVALGATDFESTPEALWVVPTVERSPG